MAFLSESKLARYTERLWANISAKFAAKEDLANLNVQDEIYIGTGEMPEGYTLQIDPEGEIISIPTPSVSDSGKFLRVNNLGAYELQTIPTAEGVNF